MWQKERQKERVQTNVIPLYLRMHGIESPLQPIVCNNQLRQFSINSSWTFSDISKHLFQSNHCLYRGIYKGSFVALLSSSGEPRNDQLQTSQRHCLFFVFFFHPNYFKPLETLLLNIQFISTWPIIQTSRKPKRPSCPSVLHHYPLTRNNKIDKLTSPENNPEVMSHLVHQLGLPNSIGFTDVFSIDEPDLLAFVPRPSHALLLVFPVSTTYENSRTKEDSSITEYTGSGPNEPVTWFKQTIRNACGLIGLLHAVSNGESKKHITPGSDLDTLLRDAQNLEPAQRADLLYESKALESAHADAAKLGDTAAPEAEDSVDLHFVAFVKGDDGTLWELDGRRKGPLARGKLGDDEDALSETALGLGVRRFLKTEAEGGNPDLRFSLVSLGPLFD